MNQNQVTELLKDYRSYQYAAINCGSTDYEVMPVILSERHRNPNTWDRSRYNRIVNMIKGAVEHVLSDDQKTVINRKYLDRNTLNLSQIAVVLNVDPSTVSRWHTEAVRKLSIALDPLDSLNKDDTEINNFDHMFDSNWRFKDPTAS